MRLLDEISIDDGRSCAEEAAEKGRSLTATVMLAIGRGFLPFSPVLATAGASARLVASWDGGVISVCDEATMGRLGS